MKRRIGLVGLVGLAGIGLSAMGAGPKEERVSVRLPGNADFPKVEVVRRRYHSSSMLPGPHNGSFSAVALLLDAGRDRTWAFEVKFVPGSSHPEELEQLLAPLTSGNLEAVASPDGKALAYSYDSGATWRVVYLDGPLPLTCIHQAAKPVLRDRLFADPNAARALALDTATDSSKRNASGVDHDGAVVNTSANLMREGYLESQEAKAAAAWLRRHASDPEVARAWTDPEEERKRDEAAARAAAEGERKALAQLGSDLAKAEAEDRATLERLAAHPGTAEQQRAALTPIVARQAQPQYQLPPSPARCALLRDGLRLLAALPPAPPAGPPGVHLPNLYNSDAVDTCLMQAGGCADEPVASEIKGWAARVVASRLSGPGPRPINADAPEAMLRALAQSAPCPLPDSALPELAGGPPPAALRPPGCEARAALARSQRPAAKR